MHVVDLFILPKFGELREIISNAVGYKFARDDFMMLQLTVSGDIIMSVGVKTYDVGGSGSDGFFVAKHYKIQRNRQHDILRCMAGNFHPVSAGTANTSSDFRAVVLLIMNKKNRVVPRLFLSDGSRTMSEFLDTVEKNPEIFTKPVANIRDLFKILNL